MARLYVYVHRTDDRYLPLRRMIINARWSAFRKDFLCRDNCSEFLFCLDSAVFIYLTISWDLQGPGTGHDGDHWHKQQCVLSQNLSIPQRPSHRKRIFKTWWVCLCLSVLTTISTSQEISEDCVLHYFKLTIASIWLWSSSLNVTLFHWLYNKIFDLVIKCHQM